MKRVLLSTVFVLACLQNVHADPFEIDLEQLGNLKKMVIQVKETNPIVSSTLNEIVQCTETKEDLSPNRIKKIAIIQAIQQTRKPNTYPPTIKDTLPSEDNLKLVHEFHNNHKLWKYTEEEQYNFYSKLNEVEKSFTIDLNDPETKFMVTAAQKSGLRLFIGKILGMTAEWTNYEDWSSKDKETAFHILKESGVLKTKIEKLDGFVYNPAEEVNHFLETFPEMDTIIVGCGHFIPQNYSSGIETPIHRLANFEGEGCHMCPHPTHHKGQLTLDLAVGQNPDIVADGTDLKFWKSILPNRLARIVDDSLEETLFNKEGLMDLLIPTLKPGGEIIAIDGNSYRDKVLYKKAL